MRPHLKTSRSGNRRRPSPASQVFGGAGLAAGITVGALLAQDMLGGAAIAGLPAALFTLGSALAAYLVGRRSVCPPGFGDARSSACACLRVDAVRRSADSAFMLGSSRRLCACCCRVLISDGESIRGVRA